MPVAIVLAVGMVVAMLVGQCIGEREAVVRGKVVHRAAVFAENIG